MWRVQVPTSLSNASAISGNFGLLCKIELVHPVYMNSDHFAAAETFLTISDGQKIVLQYVVSDLDDGTLTTGTLAIDIACRWDIAVPNIDANDKSGESTRAQSRTPESIRREQ
jgi:hypothetical protein